MRRALAAVAVTVALVAGACGNGDDGGSASGDLPLLPGSGGGGGAARSALSAESGAGGDAAATVANDAAMAPERYQPIEYRLADGIDAMGGNGAAYRLDGGIDGDAVAKVAKAFGVSGTPKDENGYWAVGDVKGGGSWVNVDRNGMFSYSNDRASMTTSSEAVSCAADAPCEAATPTPPPPVADLPSDDDAENKARELFEAAGMNLDGTESRVERTDYGVHVAFTIDVDGLAVEGLGGSMSFGSKSEVQYASGFLADVSKIGDYPLLETKPAYDRWTNGMGGGVGIAVDGVARAEPAIGAPEPAVDMPAGEQPPSTLPPKTVDIDEVELVLTVEYGRCPGDPLYLVPAYRLSADGELWGVVPAVTDEYLASAQTPEGDASDRDRGASYEPCPNEGGWQSEPGRKPESGGGTDGHPPVTI